MAQTLEEKRAKDRIRRAKYVAANRAKVRAADNAYKTSEKGKAKARARYALNPEKALAQNHANYLKHHAKRLAARKAYVEANREAVAAGVHANYLANREERCAYVKAWRAQHPNYNRDVLRANPERGRAYVERRRTLKMSLPYTFTLDNEAFCRAYFHHACAACGNQEGFHWKIVMDHFIPLTAPDCPGTIPTNMIPLCHGIGGCNNSKSKKLPEPWLTERFGPRKAAAILKKIRAYFALVTTI